MSTSQDIMKAVRAMNMAQQKSLCDATGLPAPTVAKLKYSQVADPRTSTMDKLRDYFASNRRLMAKLLESKEAA